MAYQLGALPYAYDALQPFIDAKIMELHHQKHHNTYVTKLNAALEGQEQLSKKPIDQLLREISDVPENIRQAVINHGGGHSNHTFFWEIMSPGKSEGPKGPVSEAINSTFGSFDKFQEQFASNAAALFGSGWTWLVSNDSDKKIEIIQTPNQNSPLMNGQTPLLGLDMWEHAYYLQYQNRKPEYIGAWWNTLNWEKINENYEKAQS